MALECLSYNEPQRLYEHKHVKSRMCMGVWGFIFLFLLLESLTLQ